MAAYSPYHTRSRKGPGRAKGVGRLRPPPTGKLINAVLEHADLRDDMGGGRVMLRVSPARLAEPKLRKALGPDAGRLGAMAVIWDERDDCLFRVLDGAPPALAVVERPAPSEGDRFELTPAALDYIASSQSRGRGQDPS
jgi:hypothetical protein